MNWNVDFNDFVYQVDFLNIFYLCPITKNNLAYGKNA